jgi:threonylcarbamoyladenosine tRNA methylthiotransferase MtaB
MGLRFLLVTTITLQTLGCKLNQAETEALARRLLITGYRLAAEGEVADIYILNSCTVTHIADRKCRQLLRQARRNNPDGLLIVTGCYAERDGTALKAIGGVDLVIGNEEKGNLAGILQDLGQLALIPADRIIDITSEGLRNRSFIKVQDGCDNFCAYCIVPLVRPQRVILAADEVVSLVQQRVNAGYKEVLFTGTEIGGWQADGLDLAALLERVLAETQIVRLRLSSLQPQEINHRLIHLWSNPRLCSHFHLSLQSGSDGVLKRMKRRYTKANYGGTVALIRSLSPGAAITTDVIVGFPGETEVEFRESYEFCREVNFARIHVFSFSPRPGTAAAVMPGQVSTQVKKERSQRMLKLARDSTVAFHKLFIGKVMPVLWEQQVGGLWAGLTDNYIRVYIKSNADLANRIIPVKLAKLYKDGVMGV